MSYLTEELKVGSLYPLNYFMKSEQDESGSKELGFFLGKITKRSDYVKASKGQYIKTCALFLQKVKRDDKKSPRYGVTASKKIGNAVQRNRSKRRMRALVLSIFKEDKILFKEKCSYVLRAKQSILKASFFDMQNQLKKCLSRL